MPTERYIVGQRVHTPKGDATVVGFESFTPKGACNPITAFDYGNRVIVRLDHPENWKPTLLTPDPYMFRSDLKEIA